MNLRAATFRRCQRCCQPGLGLHRWSPRRCSLPPNSIHLMVDASVANLTDSSCGSNFLASAQTANSQSAEAEVPIDSYRFLPAHLTNHRRVAAD